MNAEPEVLVVADAAAWRAWLDEHEETSDGVWLRLAKKGTVEPTSLTYAQALAESLCSGWIDGRKRSFDAATFIERFTPRRRASLWSERNIGLVAVLAAEGRMRPRGLAEVDRAKADGRWERAYAGASSAAVPDDLVAALAASERAAARFASLSRQDRYSVLHRLMTAPNAAVRAARLERITAALGGEDAPAS